MNIESIGEKKENVVGKATLTLKRKPKKQGLGSEKERVEHSMNIASGLVALSDGLALLGTGVIILYWYYFDLGLSASVFRDYSWVMLVVTTTLIVTFCQSGLYSGNAVFNPKIHCYKILGIWAVTFMVFLAIAFGLKVSEQFSRVWCFSWFLASALLICLGRYLCSLLVQRWARAGLLSRKLVIVGSGEQAKRFLMQLRGGKEPWISLVGVFDDRKERIGPSFMGLPILGNLGDLIDYTREKRVDDIVVTLPWSADQRLLEIVRRLGELPVTVSLCSDLAGFMSLHPSFSSMGGVPMLNVVNKPLDGWKYIAKLLEDKILSFLLLILLTPLILFIALAVKLGSEGPVLFKQSRKGFNGKTFSVFKFRTMVHNRPPDIGSAQAKQNDARVTNIGKFLRRTSLDELPQLLNVLSGSMSLVGPRPHPLALDDEFCNIIAGYFARHRVKPGMTGWAQVNGFRGETDTPQKMQARVEHDLQYIENWSLWFDLKILVKTAIVVASQKNAY